MGAPQGVRVVIADDHPSVRAGIRAMLSSEIRISVVAEAENGAEAIRFVQEHTPDVLLLDMEMPVMNGIEVARQLRSDDVSTRVLALSAYEDPVYVQALLASGASGYITKDKPAALVCEAVLAVARGEGRWFVQPLAAASSPLSDREDAVLKLLARGLSNQGIAEMMHLSEHTVRNHLSSIYSKLGLASSREAVAWAWETGMVRAA